MAENLVAAARVGRRGEPLQTDAAEAAGRFRAGTAVRPARRASRGRRRTPCSSMRRGSGAAARRACSAGAAPARRAPRPPSRPAPRPRGRTARARCGGEGQPPRPASRRRRRSARLIAPGQRKELRALRGERRRVVKAAEVQIERGRAGTARLHDVRRGAVHIGRRAARAGRRRPANLGRRSSGCTPPASPAASAAAPIRFINVLLPLPGLP